MSSIIQWVQKTCPAFLQNCCENQVQLCICIYIVQLLYNQVQLCIYISLFFSNICKQYVLITINTENKSLCGRHGGGPLGSPLKEELADEWVIWQPSFAAASGSPPASEGCVFPGKPLGMAYMVLCVRRPSHFCLTWDSILYEQSLLWIVPASWPGLSQSCISAGWFSYPHLPPSLSPLIGNHVTARRLSLPSLIASLHPLSFSSITYNKCLHF